MKRIFRRLVLSKETLARLDGEALRAAHGGLTAACPANPSFESNGYTCNGSCNPSCVSCADAPDEKTCG